MPQSLPLHHLECRASFISHCLEREMAIASGAVALNMSGLEHHSVDQPGYDQLIIRLIALDKCRPIRHHCDHVSYRLRGAIAAGLSLVYALGRVIN